MYPPFISCARCAGFARINSGDDYYLILLSLIHISVSKSQKIQAEIDKVKAKISEQQARLKELEQKKLEAENSEIVDICLLYTSRCV